MARNDSRIIVQCGREISSRDIEHIKTVTELCARLSRKEVAHTICEHWGWVTASGAHKVDACMKLLEKLEDRREIQLPARRVQKKPKKEQLLRKERTAPGPEVSGKLTDAGPVSVEIVSGKEATGLWNEYVDRYHYLGYKKPFGFPLRYFIESRYGPLGCMLLAGAAKSIEARDKWIGWTRRERLKSLPWVVNNARFVIFPWVRVRHLASHVLGQLARRVRGDSEKRWGYRPVLMETFVDPARYQGTSYQAAGWTMLGMTTGRGRCRPGCRYTTTPKMVYVRPLVRDFREKLSREHLAGRADK